jgi:hypothetical protein
MEFKLMEAAEVLERNQRPSLELVVDSPDISSDLGALALSISEEFGRLKSSGTVEATAAFFDTSDGYSLKSYSLSHREGEGWQFSFGMLGNKSEDDLKPVHGSPLHGATPGFGRGAYSEPVWIDNDSVREIDTGRAERIYWGMQMMMQDLIERNIEG